MRAFHPLPTSLIISLATALQFQLPDFQPFLAALSDYIPQSVQNNTAPHELLKRQSSNTCPENFDSCAALGAPGLCCLSNARCSADQAGNVACCPTGAVCTGTIAGVITAGTLNSNGVLAGGATGLSGAQSTTSFQMASSTSNNGLVAATQPATESGTHANGGFIVVDSSTVATPGSAAVRGAEVPFIAQAIIRVLEYLPL